jgi:crotonobetainyl-CoA:carnitine CoA-transferase CaiB-like acyl-CoA transferase
VLRPIEGLGEPGTRVVGLPFSFRGAPPVEAAAAPHMGEHGREVLRDWLDLDEEAAA